MVSVMNSLAYAKSMASRLANSSATVCVMRAAALNQSISAYIEKKATVEDVEAINHAAVQEIFAQVGEPLIL